MVEGMEGKGRDGPDGGVLVMFRVGEAILVYGEKGRKKKRSIMGLNSDLSTDKERSLMALDAGDAQAECLHGEIRQITGCE